MQVMLFVSTKLQILRVSFQDSPLWRGREQLGLTLAPLSAPWPHMLA